VVGSKTLAAAAGRPLVATVHAMSDLRRRRYRALAGFAAFGAGWLRRTDTVEALALAWAGQGDSLNGATDVV